MNTTITKQSRMYQWRPLFDLRNQVDQLMDDFWGVPADHQVSARTWQPACDVVEDQDHYLLSLEMAGTPKDKIKIEIQDQQLVITGERNYEDRKNQNGVMYSERHYGKFQRAFALPTGLDTEKIEANYQDGVLRVLVPKIESAKPRQVKISTGSDTSFFGNLNLTQSLQIK